MKKFTFLFVMLLMGVAAQAQSDYLPLVREGVRWHYIELWIDSQEEVWEDTPYYYEFKGDSILDGKTYKKCFVTSTKPEESGLVALVREEDKKVYRRFIDEEPSVEELIYDFNPSVLSIDYFDCSDKIQSAKNLIIQGVDCKCFQINDNTLPDEFALIEGIGADLSASRYFHGNLLSPLIEHCTCYVETVYLFDRLEDLNGNVLYKANEYSAITDLKVESKQGDNRYYNLMGQPVNNPSAGIYIHNGKKVVVK